MTNLSSSRFNRLLKGFCLKIYRAIILQLLLDFERGILVLTNPCLTEKIDAVLPNRNI